MNDRRQKLAWTDRARLTVRGRGWLARQVSDHDGAIPADALPYPGVPFLRIGHRGAAALEPENTLRGIETALRFGVDMVEVDVRPCADGTLVIAHDDHFKRVTGRRGRVSATALAELKALDVGKGERIPTLEEVLALLRGRALVNLDQKRDNLAQQLLRAIDRAGKREETMLSGNAAATFRAFHELAPSVRLAENAGAPWNRLHQRLLARYSAGAARSQAGRILAAVRGARADCATIDWRLAAPDVVRRLHRARVPVLIWTVDDLPTMQALKRAGVDGVTSNRPDLLMQLR